MPRRTHRLNKKAFSGGTNNNHVRIIAGKWRGRKVPFPDSQGLRPTSSRVRETLFNWLAPIICNARCLDLFSGSGALSFEALSRGVGEAILIDSSASVSQQLHKNLKFLASDKATVLTKNSIRWLKEANTTTGPFDIVFVDPPFNQQLAALSCKLLDDQGLVKVGSYIYVEIEADLPLKLPASWKTHRKKRSGQVAYYLCIKERPLHE